MSNLNIVIVSGRATRDPELRHTPNGNAVVGFGVANERYNKNDAENPFVGFYEVNVWGAFGELVARKLQKGDKVTVEGRLDYSSWEAEDGTKRSKVTITANNVEGEYMYRKADEARTLDEAGGSTPAPADDDIPF